MPFSPTSLQSSSAPFLLPSPPSLPKSPSLPQSPSLPKSPSPPSEGGGERCSVEKEEKKRGLTMEIVEESREEEKRAEERGREV